MSDAPNFAVELTMRRRQLIELTDQPWVPAWYRDLLTDFLQAVTTLANPYRPVVQPLAAALQRLKTRQIVDLCAGAGGPWPQLKPKLDAALGAQSTILLTDFYPYAGQAQPPAGATFHSAPIDARAVPPELGGLRTLFAGFHHFRPADAQAILADAVARQRGIALFEGTQRSPIGLLAVLISPLIVLLITPRIRPFRWRRIIFTYLLPIVPLGVLFDGVVSCLRTYTPDELRAMTAAAGPHYRWSIGELRTPGNPLPITYALGLPPETNA
jgi:hypothetical protein